MSWLLASLGQDISSRCQHLSAIHPAPLVSIRTNSLYLAAGGLSQTCHSFASPDGGGKGWVVLGTGLTLNNGSCTLLSTREWAGILSAPAPPVQDLDGHFVVLRWDGPTMECFTDRFGLRTIFILHTADQGVTLTTRLDWLSRSGNELEIDFGQFGAHWLTFNQFSHECLLRGARRLGPGGRATCTPHGVTLHVNPWLPSKGPSTAQEVTSTLVSLLRPRSDRTLSLGLSGGLDSRLLLALLQSTGGIFELHSFGNSLEPDVSIAHRIAVHQRISHQVCDDPLPRVDDLVGRLREYIAQTYLAAPASSWTKLRYYPRLHEQGKIMIDGGMGEIARRQFLNRLLYRGRAAVMRGDPAMLLPYVRIHRASIFTRDVHHLMEVGATDQLGSAWRDMPSPMEIGIENFLDLLIVRYRFPNYGGLDQVRMDGEILSYMPFAQPSFVDEAFGIPVRVKKNGRMFRRLIRTYRPELMRYPLVKGTTTYPFILPTVPAWIYTRLKERVGATYCDSAPVEMLRVLSEYVQDLVESSDVRTCSVYDHAAVKHMVVQFYKGRREFARDVDWWLSFEFWRQGMRRG